MDGLSIAKYEDLMREVKLRINAINHLHTGRGNVLYRPTTTESMCLQVRKVLELIAFGSLIAHKDLYSQAYTNFAKHWNAKFLLRDLARINEYFYPCPAVEGASNSPDIAGNLTGRNDALTKDEFVKVYEKCGAIMHADNPYGSKVDYEFYRSNILQWTQKIMNLLDIHIIRLADDARVYLVHLMEVGDNDVHSYVLQREQEA